MIMLISMKLAEKINIKIKEAMKSKDSIELESLRAIKSSILLFSTQKGNKSEISESDEIKILSKLVKQRKESADIYKSQNRLDLAQVEIDQAEIIKQFLPEQLNESEIETIVIEIINKTNASGTCTLEGNDEATGSPTLRQPAIRKRCCSQVQSAME